MLPTVYCLNRQAVQWCTDHHFPFKLMSSHSSGHISINIDHHLFELHVDSMTLQLGPRGQFSDWFLHPPKQHPLIKTIQAKLQSTSHIVDATGGLGRDSLLIALTLQQNHPHIELITYDCNPLLAAICQWHTQYVECKWQVVTAAFQECNHADIAIIDPMFPAHPKTAKPNKYTQCIQKIVAHNHGSDEHDLLKHATQIDTKHILVKSAPWQAKPLWKLINNNDINKEV